MVPIIDDDGVVVWESNAIEASITLISTMGGVGDAQLARTGGYVAGEAVGKLRRRMLTVST